MQLERHTDRPAEPFASLCVSQGESRVDEVLAACAESTPEEIMALDDADEAPAAELVADAAFEGFVTEEPRRVTDADREPVEETDGPSMDELFGRC